MLRRFVLLRPTRCVGTAEEPDSMGAAAEELEMVLEGLEADGVFAATEDELRRIFQKRGRGGTPSDP